MSLQDRHNDESSWRIGLSARFPLLSKADRRSLLSIARLGDSVAIRRFIDDRLYEARRLNGELPRIYYVRVPESEVPLALPAEAMGTATLAAFEEAATLGLRDLAAVAPLLETAGAEARVARETEDSIRAELDADAVWATATEEEYEDEVRTRLRDQQRNKPQPTEDQARTILAGMYRDQNPGMSDADIEDLVEARIEEQERVGRGKDARGSTATQTLGAISGVAESLMTVTVGALAANEDARLPVDTAVIVINAIGAVCTSVGTMLSGIPIAGAVLAIIGIILEILGAILDAIRGYTISPEQGVNSEWDYNDLLQILSARLVNLCQCDQAILGPNLSATMREVPDASNDEQRMELLKSFVYRTAKNRGDGRLDAAESVCAYLGSAVGLPDANVSMRMVRDIRAWLLYVGVKEDYVEVIYRWLYDARTATETVAYQKLVRENVGNFGRYATGYQKNWMEDAQAQCSTRTCADQHGRVATGGGKWWQCPCEKGDTPMRGIAGHGDGQECGGTDSARPNIWKGSADWYRICQDEGNRLDYSLTDLKVLHAHLIEKLNVGIYENEQEAAAARTAAAVADAYDRGGWDQGGGDAFARFMAGLPVRRFTVPGFTCWAGMGLSRWDFVEWSRQLWGDPHPALIPVVVDGRVWQVVVRTNRQVSVAATRNTPARTIPSPTLNAEELYTVASGEFLRSVQSTLKGLVAPSLFSSTAGLAVVAGVAGVAAALLLKKR